MHIGKKLKMEPQQAQISVYKSPFMQRRGEMAHPVPPRPFYPEAAMLSQPNTETQPPPPVPPFVLEQSLSTKVTARTNSTNSKTADFNNEHHSRERNDVYGHNICL